MEEGEEEPKLEGDNVHGEEETRNCKAGGVKMKPGRGGKRR